MFRNNHCICYRKVAMYWFYTKTKKFKLGCAQHLLGRSCFIKVFVEIKTLIKKNDSEVTRFNVGYS